jgi:hypothetical protein
MLAASLIRCAAMSSASSQPSLARTSLTAPYPVILFALCLTLTVQCCFAASHGLNTWTSRASGTTNMSDPNWEDLITVTNTAPAMQFLDPAANNLPRRFYRAVAP